MKKYFFILFFLFSVLVDVNSQSFNLDPIDFGDGFAGTTKRIEWGVKNITEKDYWLHFTVEPTNFAAISPNPLKMLYVGGYRFWVTATYKNELGPYETKVKLYVQLEGSNDLTYYGDQKIKMKTVQPISAPTGLKYNTKTTNSIDLGWSASTGGIGGVKEYRIYKNGVHYTTVNGTHTNYMFTNLTPNTIYRFNIYAVDNSNNISSSSSTLEVATLCDMPATVDDAKDHGNPSPDIGIKKAANAIYLKNGFRYVASGNRKYIARIESCPTPTRMVRLIDSDIEDEYIEEMQSNEQIELVAEESSYIFTNPINTSVILYPIPVKDILHIDLGYNYEEINSIGVYMISGVLMQTIVVMDKQCALNVNDYADGVYIARIYYKNGSFENIKFIVSK